MQYIKTSFITFKKDDYLYHVNCKENLGDMSSYFKECEFNK